MAAQQPGTFDKAAFIAAVRDAIEAASPKNLEEADEFKDSGKAAQVKAAVGGQVTKGKESSEKAIKETTEAPPDTSAAQPKPVTPMPPAPQAPPPPPLNAAEALPKPRPGAETDVSQGPAQVEGQMAEAGVTDEQLAKSNEPAFTGALDEKKKAGEHAATAPQEVQRQEQQVLQGGRESAEATAAAQLTGMQEARGKGLGQVAAGKTTAKTQDEGKRAAVAAKIEGIYNRAKAAVGTILDGLQAKVDAAFDSGEQAARKQFEEQVGAQMDAYKERRYSGITGAARWVADKLTGMPDEVNVFYARARAGYIAAMDRVISNVADLIGAELNAAKAQTAEARKEIGTYVAGLPNDLRSVGRDAAEQIEQRFEQLDRDVDSKQEDLVNGLAERYVEARGAVDARIDEMKAANRGLVERAFAAIGGVIRTILQLKDMLLGVLKKAADVIETIIRDPIGFLGNLLNGIKSGFTKFVGNIAAHLKSALMEWLFGALFGRRHPSARHVRPQRHPRPGHADPWA